MDELENKDECDIDLPELEGASQSSGVLSHPVNINMAVNPLKNAAITLAHSNGKLDGKWAEAARDLNEIARQLSTGDRTAAFQFLLSHVAILDEIFNQLTREAVTAKSKKDLKSMLDYALKAQNSSRLCMETLMAHSEKVEKRKDKIENMENKINSVMNKIGGNEYKHPVTGAVIDTTFDPETMTFGAGPQHIQLDPDMTLEGSVRDAMENGYSNNEIIKALLANDDIDHCNAIKIVHKLRAEINER